MKYQTVSESLLIHICFGCKRHDLSCQHSKSDLFMREDNKLFSCVRTTYFCKKADLVFSVIVV